VVVAIASSALNKPVDAKKVFIGEVGLTGEVRGISQVDIRLKEASKLGFTTCILPEVNRERVKGTSPIELYGVSSVSGVLKVLS
jgi:DNA repair protein RadA/Sms